MALDHYVSQVHLKNFYSPVLGDAFYALRKDNLKLFQQASARVCRIEENSTNGYLKDDRIIEEFLKTVEPKYNEAIRHLAVGDINSECIYVIAGFVSYVLVCSPAGMRIQSQPLKASVEEAAKMIERIADLGPPPPSLGGDTLAELIESGKVGVHIDPKYPQAIGITNILSILKIFGNSKWEILLNPFEENPFFTSDFPIVIERAEDRRVLNRVVPLSPSLAIRICPNIELDRDEIDFDFAYYQYRVKKLSRSEVCWRYSQHCACSGRPLANGVGT